MNKLLKELNERLTLDNVNCNMNAINDFIEGALTLRSQYSEEEIKKFIDSTLATLKERNIKIDITQLAKIREKCKI